MAEDVGASPARMPERLFDFESACNFQDLGGYVCAGGGRVRFGRLFRSGGLSHLGAATAPCLGALGVRTIWDLRRAIEREHGSIERYLEAALGVGTDERRALQRLLLEPWQQSFARRPVRGANVLVTDPGGAFAGQGADARYAAVWGITRGLASAAVAREQNIRGDCIIPIAGRRQPDDGADERDQRSHAAGLSAEGEPACGGSPGPRAGRPRGRARRARPRARPWR